MGMGRCTPLTVIVAHYAYFVLKMYLILFLFVAEVSIHVMTLILGGRCLAV